MMEEKVKFNRKKHPGKCTMCQKRFTPGDEINVVSWTAAHHVDCNAPKAKEKPGPSAAEYQWQKEMILYGPGIANFQRPWDGE